MKKTLIALAAMAATGAFAQSTVTISGMLDAGLAISTSVANVQTTTLASGQLSGTRLRFVGVEDMGGGSKATFWLEMQPNMVDGGTSGNGLFNRNAWLGLSGGWGELRLGRQATTTAIIACTISFDPAGCAGGFGAGGVLISGSGAAASGGGNWIAATPSRAGAGLALSAIGGGFNGQPVAPAVAGTSPGANAATVTTSGQDVTRVVRAVSYLSPNMSGFTAQVQYAFGGVAGASGDGSTTGLLAAYANGPVWAALAYSSVTGTAASPASGTLTTLSGSYDFGMAKLGLIYQKEGAAGNGGAFAVTFTDATAYALTASVPLGAARIYGRFGNRTVSGGTNTLGTVAQMVNIGATYDLSKRTRLYADYVVDTAPGQSGVMATTNPTQLGMGIEHFF